MSFKIKLRSLLLFIVCLLVSIGGLWAQDHPGSVVIKGLVTDATSGAPIANVSVFFSGSAGVMTDSTGHYTLFAARRFVKDNHLKFIYVGYKTGSIDVNFDVPKQTIDMQLEESGHALADVVVKNHKERYRNRDNPAVALIRKVIEHKDENRMNAFETASYKQYEKMTVSVSNFSEKLKSKKALKKYQFLLNNVDTTKVKGKSLLPIYLEETSSNNYFRSHPKDEKKVITGARKVDFGEFIDTKGVTKYLGSLYAAIDIYENNITLLSNQFLSPIAGSAPTFYKFYIRDTVERDGIKIVHLAFSPRNPQDMLFRGNLDITLDGHYAVQRARLFSPIGINVNFLRAMNISLDFVKTDNGRYLLTKSDMMADFGLSKKGMGLYGERVISFSDFKTDQPLADSIFKGSQVVQKDSADARNAQFWALHRTDTLTTAESKTYMNIDSLKNMKSFKRTMDWITFIFAGYKQVGPAEIGPANTFYSFNPVEGFRLRAGGRTTTRLSDRIFFEGYGAYGFKDQKFKYFGSATYSLNDKSIYKFPQNYISVSYQHDTKIPGQELQFVQEDNFFLSFKRGNNDKWLYNDYFNINYKREFENHFSYEFNARYWKQSPAGSLDFNYNAGQPGLLRAVDHVTTGEVGLTLRYAPGEVYYQTKLYRIPLINKYPIFQLRYTAGIKGLFGGEYNYNNFQANIFKRFYLSQFGFTDVTVDGGYIAGKVPYPLLSLPRANQTYAYQLNSYNLMNFMEFASDHYVSIMADHYFNGFFFNKIPLLKRLKWREVIEGKALFGGLRDENNPMVNQDQMRFPYTDGMMSTFALQNDPYFEAGFGITNIFKILRVDYVRRFTYLEHSDIAKWGIRFRIKFDF